MSRVRGCSPLARIAARLTKGGKEIPPGIPAERPRPRLDYYTTPEIEEMERAARRDPRHGFGQEWPR